MARLTLRFLGGLHAELSTGERVTFPTRKAQALLAYLALPAGRVHPRDTLAALLWRDLPMPQARSGLRQALFALRRAVGAAEPAVLRLVADTVVLDPAAVEVDVAELERLAGEGSPEALERASAMYGGELLAGLSVREAAFEEWLLGERERIRELAVDAILRLLAHQRARGALEAAVQTALKLLRLDPLQEAVHRTLMRLYVLLGRRGAALRQYQICASVVQRELGTAPEPATREVYQEILRQRPATAVTAGLLDEPDGIGRVPPLHEAPLIGRKSEVGRLRDLGGAAWSGHGRLVAVVGEAGIGKTRLIAEIAAEVADGGARVLTGRCHEGEQMLAFGPWVDALRAGRVNEDTRALEELGPVWRAELAQLLPEVGAAAPGAEGGNYLRLFESVARLLQILARRQPLGLILEDLHWADEMSVRLLAFLARRLRGSAVLVVVSAREEELAEAAALRRTVEDLAGEGHLVEMLLRPLSRADTLALVRALTRAGGSEPVMVRLADQVWTTSEGNPFVVVETVRELHESGEPGTPAGLGLPARVQAVIGRRFERLSAPAQRLAAVAAVIGREFEFLLLPCASGLDEAQTAEAAEELVRRRLLHGIGERFDFTHDRIREAIYRQLLPPRRKALHRQVAAALEKVYAANREPHSVALGLHYQEAGVWDKAAVYLRQAGAMATARSAHLEAVRCFERALDVLGRLPDSRAVREQAIDLRFDIRNSYFPVGVDARTLEHLHEAEALAARLSDRHRLGWALTYISNTYWRMADQRQALDAGERALALASSLANARLEAMTNFRLGQVHTAMGDYRQAVSVLRRSVATLDGELARERFGLAGYPAVHSRAFLASALAELGEFAEAMSTGAEAVRIAEAVNQPFSQAIAALKVGRVHILKGELPQAIAVLERGRDVCRAAGMPTVGVQIDAALGHAVALGGRPAEARALLEPAVESTATMFKPAHALAATWLSEALVLADRLDDAAHLARQVLELSLDRSEHGSQAYALRILGEIASARILPGMDPGEDYLSKSLALASRLGMRPLAAHCQLALGHGRRRTGQRRRAAEHLDAAAALFREMDAPFWLEKAEAARSQNTLHR